jgi:hypothetical protein
MASSADRQRRRRARQRRGLMALPALDVPDTWPLTLAEAGMLSEREVEDLQAVRAATERFLANVQVSTLERKK